MYDTEFERLRVKDMFYLKEDYLLKESPKVYVKISDTEAVKIMFMPIIKAINKDTKVIPVYENDENIVDKSTTL